MGKKLIDRKYLENVGLVRNGIFILKPGDILTPYANDLLCEKGVRVVYAENDSDHTPEDIKVRIEEILKNEFHITDSEITERILKRIK